MCVCLCVCVRARVHRPGITQLHLGSHPHPAYPDSASESSERWRKRRRGEGSPHAATQEHALDSDGAGWSGKEERESEGARERGSERDSQRGERAAGVGGGLARKAGRTGLDRREGRGQARKGSAGEVHEDKFYLLRIVEWIWCVREREGAWQRLGGERDGGINGGRGGRAGESGRGGRGGRGREGKKEKGGKGEGGEKGERAGGQERGERRDASFKLNDEARVRVYPGVSLDFAMSFVAGRCWSSRAAGCC